MDKFVTKKLKFSKDVSDSNDIPSNSTLGNVAQNSESEDDPLVVSTEKKKIKRHILEKFNPSWLDNPMFKDWLQKGKFKNRKGHELAFCKICQCELLAHKSVLKKHLKTEKHVELMRVSVNQQNLPQFFENKSGLVNNIKRAEIKLVGFLATNNLPFTLMDTLCPLLKDMAPDSEILKGIATKRTKATAIMKLTTGKHFKLKLSEKLTTPGSFFSLVLDETTDRSTTKQSALTVTFYNEDEKGVKTHFLDIIETPSGTADSLYMCIQNCLKDHSIPLENFVGFSSDTTNVMVGKSHSVFSLLKDQNPAIVCVKCSCHSIHLAASKACLKLPRSVEDLLRDLGAHFSRSFARKCALIEFQKYFQTEIHSILKPSNTRWLSLKSCVDRVLEQYPALEAYLKELVFEDPSKTSNEMLKTMNNCYTKIYLEFLSYVLSLLTEFNILFQSEAPLLYKLKSEVERLLTNIVSNYIELKYVKSLTNIFEVDETNPHHFEKQDNIYIGMEASESILIIKSSTTTQDLDIFYNSCLNFYIELVKDIKNRFNFVVSDPLFDMIKIVDPAHAQSFQTKSLKPIFIRFPILNTIVKPQLTEQEWREHSLLNHSTENLDTTISVEDYWSRVFNIKNAVGTPLFNNLKVVIKLLLVLPFSNASVERVFSTLNLCKTAHRNRLKTETLRAIMTTKDGIKSEKGIVAFNPSRAMLNEKLWS